MIRARDDPLRSLLDRIHMICRITLFISSRRRV